MQPFLFLFLDDSFNEDKSQKIIMDGLKDTENILKQSESWSNVRYFDRTRQFVSGIHESSKILCNLTFGTGVSIYNTQVIQAMFDAQPVCEYKILNRVS